MKNKVVEVVFIYLLFAIVLSACAAYQPTAYGQAPLQDGQVLNLYKGFATWLLTEGDMLVHSFYNPTTQITVHSRPLLDGWAIACSKSQACDDVVGYFTNIRTYKDFATWMTTSGGFYEVARNIPAMPIPTLFIMPVVLPAGYQEGDTLHAWDIMPCVTSLLCSEYDNGRKVPNPEFFGDVANEFSDMSETWEVQVIPLENEQ